MEFDTILKQGLMSLRIFLSIDLSAALTSFVLHTVLWTPSSFFYCRSGCNKQVSPERLALLLVPMVTESQKWVACSYFNQAVQLLPQTF